MPFIPVGALIYSLDQFTGIDESIRFLATLVLLTLTCSFFFLGLYVELKKRDVENKRVQFKMTGFRFGMIEMVRIVFSLVIVVFSAIVFDYATMSRRFVNVIDNIAAPPELQAQRGYSLVTMSDFDVNGQVSYGRVGVLTVVDEVKKRALDVFLSDQNFILNPIPTPFDSPIEMINALYEHEIDGMIIGSNFIHVFDELERFEEIASDTLILSQFDIEVETFPRVEIDPGKPFSILLLGLNQNDQALTSGTINTFMLLTVNLEALSFTITSIPRDSYVPIPCNNYIKDKLSHTNLGGSACAIGAIEHMFEMEIPYYVKLNFTGFMEIVDLLDGIEVDVPLAFEEQDSMRRFGADYLIRLEAGRQRLNSEQALALVRHRGKTGNSDMSGDDFTRVEHQQLVFQAMLSDMFDQIESVNDILPLLEVIGNHVETNLNAHELMTIGQYLIGLLSSEQGSTLMREIHFINIVILGDTTVINVRHYGRLWVSFPWIERIAEARRLMMINLGLEAPEFSFTFEYNGFMRPKREWGQITISHENAD